MSRIEIKQDGYEFTVVPAAFIFDTRLTSEERGVLCILYAAFGLNPFTTSQAKTRLSKEDEEEVRKKLYELEGFGFLAEVDKEDFLGEPYLKIPKKSLKWPKEQKRLGKFR